VSWFLPRLVGISQALECAIPPRSMRRKRCAGIVSEIVEPEEVLARARAVAREIIDNHRAGSIA